MDESEEEEETPRHHRHSSSSSGKHHHRHSSDKKTQQQPNSNSSPKGKKLKHNSDSDEDPFRGGANLHVVPSKLNKKSKTKGLVDLCACVCFLWGWMVRLCVEKHSERKETST